MRLVCFILLSACVRVERADDHVVDATDIDRLVARVDRGSLDVRGGTTDSFAIDATSVGTGANKAKASMREQANRLDVDADPPDLIVRATSAYDLARWEISIAAPARLDVNASLDGGTVELSDIEGDILVSASQINLTDMVGRVDLRSDGGISATVSPWDDTENVLEANGPVLLQLPPDGPYDLRVVGDPDQPMLVEDLGFDSLVLDDGYVEAWRSPGTIVIRVDISGGDFTLIPW